MSYFPTDIPFMSEEELKANGIEVNCSEKPNNSKLKPCPFCGGKAVVVEAVDEPGAWKVFCTNPDCDAQYGWCADREYVIKGWNRRAKNERTD